MSAQTLYRQKLDSMPEIYAADSMCLSLLVFTVLLSEVAQRQADKPARKQILARNSQSTVKVIQGNTFWGHWK